MGWWRILCACWYSSSEVLCTLSHTRFLGLINPLTRIDARKLSIEQLYQARREEWCIDYDEFLRGTGNIPEVLLYDENKYEGIIRHILRSGILEDVDYDRRQVSMLGRRLQKDLNKIRRLANP